jgi:arginyl-tRNA--protein-N-Asp/Glu arginylyltransferase
MDPCLPERPIRDVTHYLPQRQLRFFLTAPTPCPYLPGREERKVFAHLPLTDGPASTTA